MDLREAVVLDGEFQHDLLAAVLHVGAAVDAVRIGLSRGQLRRIHQLVGMAVEPVPERGDQLGGLHRRRRDRVNILDDVVGAVQVIDRVDALADQVIRQLTVLVKRRLLRVARVLAHVVAVLVFDAPVDDGIKHPAPQLKLDRDLFDAAVVIKAAVNAVGIDGLVGRRAAHQHARKEQGHKKKLHFKKPSFRMVS